MTEKRTRKRMDALKASMLLKVSSVTKSEQRLLVDLPCMRHALMAKSGNPSSAARLMRCFLHFLANLDAPEFVRLQHFSIIPPMLETFLNSQL